MKRSAIVVTLIGVACLFTSAPARAQECPCDCYFSGDCQSGNFCNWGSLSTEDSCFWRQPKPQGVVGANCDADYDDWGQCDGICTPTAAPSVFTNEPVPMLVDAVELWGEAFATAAAGGGFPDAMRVHEIDSMDFSDPRVPDGVGKVVIEVLMLARGEDSLEFPRFDGFTSGDIQSRDLTGDTCRLTAGDVAIRALVAEMKQPGSGAAVMATMPLGCRDATLLQRVCAPGQGPIDCIYQRIADHAEVMARGGRGGIAAGGPSCAGECTVDTECDDGNPCTRDICDENNSCTSSPSLGSCDDGDPCTANDFCSGGVCVGGGPATCGDTCDDCNKNNIPDECENTVDCDANGVPDECELATNDCNGNGEVDDCEMFIICPPLQPCYMFNDCNGNGVLDECDVDNGATDTNDNNVPDECEIPFPPTAVAEGPRYLRIIVPLTTDIIALRLTSPDFPCWTQWLAEDGTLTGEPVYQLGQNWSDMVLTDASIVPDTDYVVEAVGETGLPSTASTARTWLWGDVSNDQIVNFEDIQQTVLVFQGDTSQRTIQNTDLEPCDPNEVVNFGDILRNVSAFQGASYAETSCPMPCP